MAAEPAVPRPQEERVGPFSMTDEEGDIARFAAYLGGQPPEALWDIYSHLDAERYPRRREALLREMERRRLFFVPPYTRQEIRLRTFLGVAVFVAALAAFLRAAAGVVIDAPYERLPFFTDLAVGGPKAARLVLPVVALAAHVLGLMTFVSTFGALLLLARRRIRGDIAAMAVLASAVILALLLALRG